MRVTRDDIPGLTPTENRELRGVLNPKDTMDLESRTGDDGALQKQLEYFQDTINKTMELRDEIDDTEEFLNLEERIVALREARDRTVMQKELEEGRQAQEEDISRFRKFVKWLGKEKVGLTGVAVSTAGLITTLLIHARGAIIGTAKATSKVAKALANLAKKAGPILVPILNAIATALSWGAKGGGQKVEGYKLENLELEYETIENDVLASEVSSMYTSGRSLSYKHVTLMRTSNWDLTIVNENINIPRKSMSAIVLLFTNKVRTDSEQYLYPNLEKVRLTIEGVPNSVFSQGLPKSRFFEEAKRFFCPMCEKSMADEFMSIDKFYKDGFALVIDLRSTQDDTTGGGKKIVNTQSGVLLEITKKATTADVQCNIFVVSDALLNFANRDLSSIQY